MDFPMELLENSLREMEIPIELDETARRRLETYAALLVEWNRKMNLTAIVEPEAVAVKHFADSAALFKYVELLPAARVIDVGTGAGFPGLVVKILRPDIRLTLLDSLQKRLRFLEAVCEAIGLPAQLVHARAEEAGRQEAHREGYDLATARAVARLPLLSEYCLPFVKQGGCFCALKGPDGQAESAEAGRAVQALGGGQTQVFSYTLPGGDGRTVIRIEKRTQTPTKYPRNPAQIAKNPWTECSSKGKGREI